MTFDAIQTGPLGQTVELYEFVESGVFTRITSAATSQFDGSIEYEPLAGLKRSRPIQGNEATSGDIELDVPATFPIAAQFRGTIPSSFPSLTIFKRHNNDGVLQLVTYWKGVVVNCAFGDQTAKLICRPITRIFERPIPRAVYSGTCNHQLFDQGCQVIRADFTHGPTALTTIDSVGTTLRITGLRAGAAAINTAQSGSLTAQEIDDYWQRGIISSVGSPGEFRMIVETDIGADPDVVRINIPFRSVDVGDMVSIAAGCPHSIDFCDRKFDNAVNNGGFAFVPTDNPFEKELDSGRSTGVAPRTLNIFR